MVFQERKMALLASICFFLAFYLPPIMGKRYTNALFLLWLPILITDMKFIRLRRLVFFTTAILGTILLVKSIQNPSFFRDGLIFSFYSPLVIICGFISGKKMSESGESIPKIIVSLTLGIQAIICLIQINSREFGLLLARLYSLDKYKYMFEFLRNWKSVGTFGNHNYLGFIFLLSILLFITYFKEKKFVLLLPSIPLLFVAMISTGSRASIMFLVILITLFVIITAIYKSTKRRENLVIFPIFIFILVISIILFAMIGVELFNAVTALLGRGSPDYSSWKELFLQKRIPTWSNAEISHIGVLELLFGRSNEIRVTTDNLYLTLLLIYGLVGTIFILFLSSSVIFMYESDCVSIEIKILAYCIFAVFVISGVVADYWFNSSITPIYFFMIGSLFEASKKNVPSMEVQI